MRKKKKEDLIKLFELDRQLNSNHFVTKKGRSNETKAKVGHAAAAAATVTEPFSPLSTPPSGEEDTDCSSA